MTVFPDFYRGDDYALSLSFTHAGQPVDISGWQMTSTMKLASELPSQPELSDDGYRQVLPTTVVANGNEAKKGKVCLLFPNTMTRELLPVPYVIDVQRCYLDVVTTLLTGVVKVKADVSQEVCHG